MELDKVQVICINVDPTPHDNPPEGLELGKAYHLSNIYNEGGASFVRLEEVEGSFSSSRFIMAGDETPLH